MGTLELFAPAKLNLHLAVGALRPDGFHDVTTVLQAVELGDTVTLEPAEGLALSCEPDLGVRAADNLAYRAAEAFAAACGRDANVAIGLRKRIPAGAGLGGGSSDAAAVLKGLSRMWDIPLGDPRVRATAASLGADVPFFLGAPCALMAGRGDELVRELDAPVFHVLIIWPRVPVPTVEAYAALDAAPPAADEAPDRLIEALEGGDWRRAATRLRNDMTAASSTLVPAIAEALALLEGAEEVVGAAMCGSGSAVFGVCASEAAARNAAGLARDRGWWAAPTQTAGGAKTIGWVVKPSAENEPEAGDQPDE